MPFLAYFQAHLPHQRLCRRRRDQHRCRAARQRPRQAMVSKLAISPAFQLLVAMPRFGFCNFSSFCQCGLVLVGREGEAVPAVRGGQEQLHRHLVGDGEADRHRHQRSEEYGEGLRARSQLRIGTKVAAANIIPLLCM